MKKVAFIISLFVLVGATYGIYLFNKKSESLQHIEPDYTLNANDLFNEFNQNEQEALKKYEGKVIEVTGQIIMISQSDSISNVILNANDALFGGINCSFNKLEDGLNKEDVVSIKGRCQGFLTSVILNNCTLEK